MNPSAAAPSPGPSGRVLDPWNFPLGLVRARAGALAGRCDRPRAAGGTAVRRPCSRGVFAASRAQGRELMGAAGRRSSREPSCSRSAHCTDRFAVQASVCQLFLDWYAAQASTFPGARGGQRPCASPARRGGGAIVPRNFPLGLSFPETACSALLAGCSVVLKPLEETPRSASCSRRSLRTPGLPAYFVQPTTLPGVDTPRSDDRAEVIGSGPGRGGVS